MDFQWLVFVLSMNIRVFHFCTFFEFLVVFFLFLTEMSLKHRRKKIRPFGGHLAPTRPPQIHYLYKVEKVFQNLSHDITIWCCFQKCITLYVYLEYFSKKSGKTNRENSIFWRLRDLFTNFCIATLSLIFDFFDYSNSRLKNALNKSQEGWCVCVMNLIGWSWM